MEVRGPPGFGVCLWHYGFGDLTYFDEISDQSGHSIPVPCLRWSVGDQDWRRGGGGSHVVAHSTSELMAGDVGVCTNIVPQDSCPGVRQRSRYGTQG